MHKLLQREQQPGESADDYIHSIQQLASRLKKPMIERQLVKVVKKGLRNKISRFVYAMVVLTVDELREECVEVERSFGRRAPWTCPKTIQARLLELPGCGARIPGLRADRA